MNHRVVDRGELVALLGVDRGVCALARKALDDGADFRRFSGSASALELTDTYSTRVQTTADQGIATVGLTEAVDVLRTAGSSRVAIVGIGGLTYGWYFVVFIDHESGRLLACTGVEQRTG